MADPRPGRLAARERGVVRPKIAALVADPDRRRELDVAKEWGYRLHEWRTLSDEDRELLLAHATMVCPRCGNLRSECSDPDRDWHPRISECYASAATKWGWRKIGERYPAEAKTADGAHPLDGVTVWVSETPPLDGEDDFA